MKNQPFFSIITCVYNSASYLQQTIDSVLSQSFTDFEHIFIYSPSVDDSLQIIKIYQKKSPSRVRIVNQTARGISAAMNLGVGKSRGKYCLHLHSDDFLYSSEVLLQASHFIRANPGLDWTYGQIQPLLENGQKLKIFPSRKIFQISNRCLLHFYNFIPHQAVFVKRKIFAEYGGFLAKYHYCMDYDFWLRISPSTIWKFMPIPISCYRIHEAGISSAVKNKKAVSLESLQIKKSHLSPVLFPILYFMNYLLSFRS